MNLPFSAAIGYNNLDIISWGFNNNCYMKSWCITIGKYFIWRAYWNSLLWSSKGVRGLIEKIGYK